jgi:hypothetical protein
MIVESYAPYTVTCLLNVGLSAASNPVEGAFHPFFATPRFVLLLLLRGCTIYNLLALLSDQGLLDHRPAPHNQTGRGPESGDDRDS